MTTTAKAPQRGPQKSPAENRHGLPLCPFCVREKFEPNFDEIVSRFFEA
jgi:hypothetical protein